VAITWTFKLVNHLNSFVLYFTSTLNYVTSISRAYEYIDGIPTEFRIEDEEERTKRLDNILDKNKMIIEKMGEQLEQEIERMLTIKDENESKKEVNAPVMTEE
jgi:hypothetical protein